MDRLEFNEQLADAARHAAEEPAGPPTLDRAVALPVELIEHCDLAGLSVVSHTRAGSALVHPAVTNDDVRRINDLQNSCGEGPLVELRHDDTVLSGNVNSDHRWTQWGFRVSTDYGIRSAMAFRLFTDGRTQGALTLYSEKPDAFTRADFVDGLAMAAHTGVILAAGLELDQMHTAMLSRQTIGEAVGMLRGRFTLTSDQAFNVLKRLSSQQNVKLARIAEQIVETGELPSPPTSTS